MSVTSEKIKRINSVSSSFCLAKWLQVTIDLVHGETQSCHHTIKHPIPYEDLQKNISALHNTWHKKVQRNLMLQGIRPTECSYCWKMEDIDIEDGQISDRFIKTSDYWAYPYLDSVIQIDWKENIKPTYLEVM